MDLEKIKELAVELKKSIYDRYGVTESQMLNIHKDKINEIINLINILIENFEVVIKAEVLNQIGEETPYLLYNAETESLDPVNMEVTEEGGN